MDGNNSEQQNNSEQPAQNPSVKATPLADEEVDLDVLPNDDERLYPELVDRPAQFEGTDEEEEDENTNIGVDGDDEDVADRPVIEYDKENPSLTEGSVFPSMIAMRNALATYCLKNELFYVIDKSEPKRLTVHCYFDRCQWRLHASLMRNSTLIQVKVNTEEHNCPSAERSATMKLCKRRWCADAVLEWVTENPSITTSELVKNIKDKYNVEVPYMRVWYGKEMALDIIYGPWTDSFKLLHTYKAEVEKACPGSVVEIDHHPVEYKIKGKIRKKECFRRMFVSFKACWKGFLDGCRPYLAVDATSLNGRYRGQLVAACAIDAHNWLFPVAYGVVESESTESWTWFMNHLYAVIGNPDGLTIHTDASKGLEKAVEDVFPNVEHRECMRHLTSNFSKHYKGKLFFDNLWPAAKTCVLRKHDFHVNQMFTKSGVKEYLTGEHRKIWARSKFNGKCKIDYLNNNLAECFNSWIKDIKGYQLSDLIDKIRQMLMAKFELRQRIASEKFVGHKIIPAVMKELYDNTRNLKMKLLKQKPLRAEVTVLDKEKREFRYVVDLEKRTCSCREWLITGLPCNHALFFITSLRGSAAEIDQYAHEYYSVAKFNATYAENVPSLESKHQWDIVDPGIIMHPPIQGRSAGRPKKERIRSSVGAKKGLGPRKRKCRRCGRLGHIARNCKHAIDPAFGEDAETRENSATKAKKGKGKTDGKLEKSIRENSATKAKKGKGKTDGKLEKSIKEKSATKAKKSKRKTDEKMEKSIGEKNEPKKKKPKKKGKEVVEDGPSQERKRKRANEGKNKCKFVSQLMAD